ncbi:MAG: hypothetical protein CUN56_03420 [Phototrophicales bacterium]|nr:MAG: hypothetical protein CUN56_03420 [Phototrophicales bacterium]
MRGLIIACLLCLFTLPILAQETDDETVIVTDFFGNEVTISDRSRIISIGGAVTEVIYELGYGDNLVAVDESSIYPQAATELPQVGYLRFLSAEPILSYNPTLIITTEDAGPPEALEQLRAVGIPVLVVPAEDTLQGAVDKIRPIAAALNRVEEGEQLIAQMQADIEQAQALTANLEERPRVLFVFAGSSVALGVLGQETGANEMLRLAGATNVIEDQTGYIPLTSEAIVAAAPDIIVTTSLSVERVGGYERFLQLPGIALTPAAENGRIIYEGLDDLYLLGFTPRLGDAILDLTYLLHESLPRPIPVVIRLNTSLNLFEDAIDASELEDILMDTTGLYTVFAPSDTALADFTGELDPAHYVIEGAYSIDELTPGTTLTALDGHTLTITQDLLDALVITDLEAANGIIHVVDMVLSE